MSTAFGDRGNTGKSGDLTRRVKAFPISSKAWGKWPLSVAVSSLLSLVRRSSILRRSTTSSASMRVSTSSGVHPRNRSRCLSRYSHINCVAMGSSLAPLTAKALRIGRRHDRRLRSAALHVREQLPGGQGVAHRMSCCGTPSSESPRTSPQRARTRCSEVRRRVPAGWMTDAIYFTVISEMCSLHRT